METKTSFGDKLNALRQARNLSVQQLADLAGVSQPLISNLIHNHRVIGEYTARKIAHALQLKGDEFDSFIFLAVNGCTEKVLEASKGYPAELINLVARKLGESGIAPDEINRCVRNQQDADVALSLKDGRDVRIKLELAGC